MSGVIFLMIMVAMVMTVAYSVLIYPWLHRRQVLTQPLPDSWKAYVEKALPFYRYLSDTEKSQLEAMIKCFVDEKKFYGCNGLEITPQIKIIIAAQACLLLLNRSGDIYPKLHYVLVYPHAFRVQRDHMNEGGVVENKQVGLLGESWGNGKVILSWDDIEQDVLDTDDGHNVVLHEFAHQLDSETGVTNGAPYMPKNRYAGWAKVLSEEYHALQAASHLHLQTVMDQYGATNEAEFFAVATETFFEKPHQLAFRHPELFHQLKDYYHVDPRQWHEKPVELDMLEHSQVSSL